MSNSDITVAEWQFGDVTLKRVTEMVTPTPAEFVYAVTDDAPAMVELSIHTFIVVRQGVTTIVDTCVGNCRVIPGLPDLTVETPFLEHLAAAGVTPTTVDHVINTHLHFDHVGWNTRLVDDNWVPTFQNAIYHINRDELAYWTSAGEAGLPFGASVADATNPLRDAGLLHEFDSSDSLPVGFTVWNTPGHTPGHVSLLCDTSEGTLVISGDVLHNPWQFSALGVSAHADSDPLAAVTTRRVFAERCADEHLLVCGTHFGGVPVGRVSKQAADRFAFDSIAV